MTLDLLLMKVSMAQGRKLSGGITCNGLRIQQTHLPGKLPELLVTGNVTITIKVFDLTSNGAPRLYHLMQYTQHNIANKLRGETVDYGLVIENYNIKANRFDRNTKSMYNVRYRINYIVKLEQINRLSQLTGNDFVLAIVDRIGFKSRGSNDTSIGLTNGKGGPATVNYSAWNQNPIIATHEFFHTLGLPDLFEHSNSKRLMFNLASKTNNIISNNELAIMNTYLLRDLVDMTSGSYTRKGLDTLTKLQIFLNNPTNGFKYNKAKFK